MKKIVALLLTILLVFTIVGCRQADNLDEPTTTMAGDESSEDTDELTSESELDEEEEDEADDEDEAEEDDADDDVESEDGAESENGNNNGAESAADLLVGHEDNYMCEVEEDTFYEDDPWGYYFELVDGLEDELWEAFDELFDRLCDRIYSLGEQESQIEALEDRFDLFEEEIYDLLDELFEQRDEESITVQEFEVRMRELIERIRNFQI